MNLKSSYSLTCSALQCKPESSWLSVSEKDAAQSYTLSFLPASRVTPVLTRTAATEHPPHLKGSTGCYSSSNLGVPAPATSPGGGGGGVVGARGGTGEGKQRPRNGAKFLFCEKRKRNQALPCAPGAARWDGRGRGGRWRVVFLTADHRPSRCSLRAELGGRR